MYLSVLIPTPYCRQVHIGTALAVNVGILSYSGAADVIFGATVSAIFVVVVVIATIVCLVTVGCKQYKIRLSHAKAQNEQLELEVINMESQVTMMHGQMRGIHIVHMHTCTCKNTHTHLHTCACTQYNELLHVKAVCIILCIYYTYVCNSHCHTYRCTPPHDVCALL